MTRIPRPSFPLGTRVYDVHDERHVGVLTEVQWSCLDVVRFDNGWIAYVPLKRLRAELASRSGEKFDRFDGWICAAKRRGLSIWPGNGGNLVARHHADCLGEWSYSSAKGWLAAERRDHNIGEQVDG